MHPKNSVSVVASADPMREKELLAKLNVGYAPGSKRKRQEENRTELCRSWLADGTCHFGSSCKFAHSATPQTTDERSRKLLRTLATERDAHTTAQTDVDDPSSGAGPADADEVDEDGSAPLTIPSVIQPLTAVQRYYTTMYRPDADGSAGNDQYVHIQSNRICVVGLAPSHPILRHNLRIVSVKFAAAVDSIEVSGKKKRGNVYVDHRTTLAVAQTACGKSFNLRSGMRGDVLEMNDALVHHPDLLRTHPATAGHIAVFNLKLKSVLDLHASLLSVEDYTELCALRGLPSTYEASLTWTPPVHTPSVSPAAPAVPAASSAGTTSDGSTSDVLVASAEQWRVL